MLKKCKVLIINFLHFLVCFVKYFFYIIVVMNINKNITDLQEEVLARYIYGLSLESLIEKNDLQQAIEDLILKGYLSDVGSCKPSPVKGKYYDHYFITSYGIGLIEKFDFLVKEYVNKYRIRMNYF